MLTAVAPEATDWSTFFAAGAPLRLAVDAGRFDAVDAEHAERTLCAAEDFLDDVRTMLEGWSTRETGPTSGAARRPGEPVSRPLRAVRAS
jgi:hypothetical protein